jgi:hypothetical protein
MEPGGVSGRQYKQCRPDPANEFDRGCPLVPAFAVVCELLAIAITFMAHAV